MVAYGKAKWLFMLIPIVLMANGCSYSKDRSLLKGGALLDSKETEKILSRLLDSKETEKILSRLNDVKVGMTINDLDAIGLPVSLCLAGKVAYLRCKTGRSALTAMLDKMRLNLEVKIESAKKLDDFLTQLMPYLARYKHIELDLEDVKTENKDLYLLLYTKKQSREYGLKRGTMEIFMLDNTVVYRGDIEMEFLDREKRKEVFGLDPSFLFKEGIKAIIP